MRPSQPGNPGIAGLLSDRLMAPAAAVVSWCRRPWPPALAVLAALLLWGCSAVPERPVAEPDACRAMLTDLDRAIETETHFDPNLRRVEGWPLLRTNRFLASFAYDDLPADARAAWLEHAFDLGREAYTTEFARLSGITRRALEELHGFDELDVRLASCFARTPPPDALPVSAYRVPDSYSTTARAFGLYPVTSLVASGFIARYRQDMTRRYLAGRATRFEHQIVYEGPGGAVSSASLPLALETDPLGVPQLSAEEWDALFRKFAPQVIVEQRSHADRIGTPVRDADDRIRIDTGRPAVFTFPGYTRLDSRVLPQLNYAFWFPERPPESRLDLFAGELSGVLWRVTLDHALHPVLYDSIHQCGCYHKLFVPMGSRIDLEAVEGERPLVFTLDPNITQSRGLRLRLEAGQHYIIDVAEAFPAASTERYVLESYASHLQLPAQGTDSAQSLFGPTGIVQQSRRPERFVFWPLGVASAGAMRQQGLHAIAFVGRRHFDDPDLLESLGFAFDPR